MNGPNKLINMSVLIYNPELEGTRFDGPIGVRQPDTQDLKSKLLYDLDKDSMVLVDVRILPPY
jgi:hypothetical protein